MKANPIRDAILADPDLSVSIIDATELAECVRRCAMKQPLMQDGEGKHRGQHWPTRCFGLSCQIARLEEQLNDRR